MSSNKRVNDPSKITETLRDVKKPFTFIVGADPQFGLIARYIEKKPTVDWEKELVQFKSCVRIINKLTPKPKMFAIIGDMLDAQPISDERLELRQKQEQDFFPVVDMLDEDISFVTVCGNHDVGDVPTPSAVEKYRASFGKDYFDFVLGGLHFIVINSQYYVNSSEVSSIANEQESWLNAALEKAQGSSIGPIILMHIPPFVSDPNEPDSYFSLVKEQRDKLLNKFVAAGVKYVFCGHLHKNAGGKYKDLEVITTTAIGGQLGQDKPGFRIVTAYEDRLEHSFVTIDDSN